MNTIENTTSEESISQARSQRVTAVAWLTGVTAVCALGFLSEGATVGMGIGVIGIAAMVSIVSYFLLKY
jgi:hypothetical protein